MNDFTITWRTIMDASHKYSEVFFIDADNGSSLDELSHDDLVRLHEQLGKFLDQTNDAHTLLPEMVPMESELEHDDISSCDDFLNQYGTAKRARPAQNTEEQP